MYKAIVFDFGGVFSINDDIQKFLEDNAAKFNIDLAEAKSIWLPLWLNARIGKIDSNIFWEKLGSFVKMDAVEFKKYFIGCTGFRNDLYGYVENKLRGKYKLAILSNQIKSWLGPILEEKKFRELFDVIITSYDVGLAKPDVEMYKMVLEKLNVKAKECVYIDDAEKNLEPAQALGVKTIEFKNYNQCVEVLEELLRG